MSAPHPITPEVKAPALVARTRAIIAAATPEGPADVFVLKLLGQLADELERLAPIAAAGQQAATELPAALAEAERWQRQVEDIERTLEAAYIPDTLPDDPDDTPLSVADRVEVLAESDRARLFHLERLREAFAELDGDTVWIYGHHLLLCPLKQREKGDGCTCGFNAAVARVARAHEAARRTLKAAEEAEPAPARPDDETSRDAARWRFVRDAVLREPLPQPMFRPHSYGVIWEGPRPITPDVLDRLVDEALTGDDGRQTLHEAPKLTAEMAKRGGGQ